MISNSMDHLPQKCHVATPTTPTPHDPRRKSQQRVPSKISSSPFTKISEEKLHTCLWRRAKVRKKWLRTYEFRLNSFLGFEMSSSMHWHIFLVKTVLFFWHATDYVFSLVERTLVWFWLVLCHIVGSVRCLMYWADFLLTYFYNFLFLSCCYFYTLFQNVLIYMVVILPKHFKHKKNIDTN